MWTTCKWIMIHIDYWLHLLDSLRMFALSLLPDTVAERIIPAVVHSKLNSRVCLCVCVCILFVSVCVCFCNSEASVPLVMLTQQQQLLFLWPRESCEADTRKNEWEKSVVKNKKEVQKCTVMKRKDLIYICTYVTATAANCVQTKQPLLLASIVYS